MTLQEIGIVGAIATALLGIGTILIKVGRWSENQDETRKSQEGTAKTLEAVQAALSTVARETRDALAAQSAESRANASIAQEALRRATVAHERIDQQEDRLQAMREQIARAEGRNEALRELRQTARFTLPESEVTA